MSEYPGWLRALLLLLILSLPAAFIPASIGFGFSLPLIYLILFATIRFLPYKQAVVTASVVAVFSLFLGVSAFIASVGLIHIIIIGYLFKRYKRDIFTWTMLYGLLVFILSYIYGRLFIEAGDPRQIDQLIVLSHILQLLLASLVVDTIGLYWCYCPIVRKRLKASPPIKYGQVIFSGVLIVSITPLIALIFIQTHLLKQEMLETFEVRETQLSEVLTEEITRLDQTERQRLELGSAIDRGRMMNVLGQHIGTNDEMIYIFHGDRTLIQTNEYLDFTTLEQHLVQGTIQPIEQSGNIWLVGNGKQPTDWYDGYYLSEFSVLDHDIVYLIPMREPVMSAFRSLIFYYQLTLFIVLLAFSVAVITERLLTRQLKQLNFQAREIPLQMKSEEAITRQPSRVVEFDLLSDHLAKVSRQLKDMFNTLEEKNEELHEKTQLLEKREKELNFVAHHDALTKLPNRRQFYLDLERELEDQQQKLAVLFLDLNDFKRINDQYSHKVGDYLLVQVGRRLKALESNYVITFYRLAGDEFVAIYKRVETSDYDELLRDMHRTLERPFSIQDGFVDIDFSLGAGFMPEDGNDFDRLLHVADQQMYADKKSNKEKANKRRHDYKL